MSVELMSVADRVVAVVAVQFGIDVNVDPIGRETSLVKDLGADSLDVTELTMELEEEFSEGDFVLDIPDEDSEKLKTVGQIIGYISNSLNNKAVA
jgi:acyl carrier protein